MDRSAGRQARFISFQKEHDQVVLAFLQQLNSTIKPIDFEDWRKERSTHGHYVDLLHPFTEPDCAALVQKLHTQPQRNPLLCIVHRNTPWVSDELLAFCDDFVYWPCSEDEIQQRIDRLKGQSACSDEPVIRQEDYEKFVGLQLVGRSPAFRRALDFVRQAAKYESPVLIEGETGTGKEMVARAIHYIGVRNGGPFIPVNCGAIPDELFANELFGHKRGAYTDANQDQMGLVEQAEQGTLFLDEIETLSHKGQVILIRFLQDMVYKALGSKRHRKGDIRIIAATNVPLVEMVHQGDFRQDLLFRLNILPVRIPPLRERFEDIELLARHFLKKFKEHYGQTEKYLHCDSMRHLWRYDWPGNVREMENVIHRAFILAKGKVIRPAEHLTNKVIEDRPAGQGDDLRAVDIDGTLTQAKQKMVTHFEVVYLTNLLKKTDGNITKAAAIAGKERRALGKLIKKHGIDRNDC
ncbi:MAG: AAA family ATPase [Chitinivibrionales bacterium]|nr:AAA family ATPase [Chitinivibrionales bacterium]MBD3357265.1 AAA family ATPase [Chitinivibrionales bacterium]